MSDIDDAPSTCRSCAFLVKCFGQPGIDPVERTLSFPDDWRTYPQRVDETGTRVIRCGHGDVPIVFVHGPGGSADRFNYNLVSFARRGFASYAIDLPGHGFADKQPSHAASITSYAGFLAKFLIGLGTPSIVVGTCLGANVAARVASEAPDLVRSLVLVGGGGISPLGEDIRRRLSRLPVYRTWEGARERIRRSVFDARAVTPSLVEQEYRMNTSPGAEQAMRQLSHYLDTRIDEETDGPAVAAISRIPILLIWGAEDRIVPMDYGRRQIELFHSRPSFISIANAGHLPFLERPGDFNQRVLEFLTREMPSGPLAVEPKRERELVA